MENRNTPMDMTLSEYLIEAVARRRAGKYSDTIDGDTELFNVIRAFENRGFECVDGNVMVNQMEGMSNKTGVPVFKRNGSWREQKLYLSVPGTTTFVMTYIPQGNEYVLCWMNRIHNKVADPVDRSSKDEWLDEINGWLK